MSPFFIFIFFKAKYACVHRQDVEKIQQKAKIVNSNFFFFLSW